MATPDRSSDPALSDPTSGSDADSGPDSTATPAEPSAIPEGPLPRRLLAEPYRFGFFQAVRLLEQLCPDRAPVGGPSLLHREVVRFRAHNTLAFPASEIQRLDITEPPDRLRVTKTPEPETETGSPTDAQAPQSSDQQPARPTIPSMTVNFFGLTGPLGTLPTVYTEELTKRRRDGDRSTAAFFDLFNHRLISLFYQAWAKHEITVAATRQPDAFAAILFDLIGLGHPTLRDRSSAPDDLLPHFAGAFVQQRRPALMLQRTLQCVLGHPVHVEQLVGRWIDLEVEDQTKLGQVDHNGQLGTSALAGTRVLDHQATVRVRLGPLDRESFLGLLPDGPPLRRLADLILLYVGLERLVEFQLVLCAEQVPPTRLDPDNAPRLGQMAWLVGEDGAPHDADEVRFPSPADGSAMTTKSA